MRRLADYVGSSATRPHRTVHPDPVWDRGTCHRGTPLLGGMEMRLTDKPLSIQVEAIAPSLGGDRRGGAVLHVCETHL